MGKRLIAAKIFLGLSVITIVMLRHKTEEEISDHDYDLIPLILEQKLSTQRPRRKSDDVSCHRMQFFKEIPNIQNLNPPEQSIFFHETSCRSFKKHTIYLAVQQACAVESAALKNPNHTIFVMFASPVDAIADSRISKLLRKYKNIRFVRVLLSRYAANTPAFDLVRFLLPLSEYPKYHTNDVLRSLTLWRYPGVYLDLDTISVKGLDVLPKGCWIGAEDQYHIGAGAVSLDSSQACRLLAKEFLQELADTFSPRSYSGNSQGVLTRVLRRHCVVNGSLPQIFPANCTGIKILDPSLVYPIPYWKVESYFEPNNHGFWRGEEMKGVLHHTWRMRQKHDQPVNPTSFISHLARVHCPLVYKAKHKYGFL